MAHVYDAIVVGAGPAGVAAATHLCRAGLSVALLDHAQFPRDKTCGDGISAAATDQLQSLGVLARVIRQAPVFVSRARVVGPNGREFTAPLAASAGKRRQGMVLPRKIFDHVLFSYVSGLSGVTVFQDFRLTGLCRANGRVTGVEGTHEKKARVLAGRCVVGADGVFSAVAAASGLSVSPVTGMGLGVRAYFEGADLPSDCYTLCFDRSLLPGYAWIFPLAGGGANAGAWTTARVLGRVNIRELFFHLVRTHPVLSKALREETMVPGTCKGRPLAVARPLFRRGNKNVILAGDAGGFCDPATGEGIFHALKTGELAARAIVTAGTGDKGFLAATEIYERLCRRTFLARTLFSGLFLGQVLSRPGLTNGAFAVERAMPGAFARALAAFNFFRKR